MSFFSDLFDRHWIPEPNSGCWLWFGACNENGYGIITRDKENIKAHRFSYERSKGAIPEKWEIDHLCRNKSCVNPDHLEVVTHGENRRRVPRNLVYQCTECGKDLLRKHKSSIAVRCMKCSHRDAQLKWQNNNPDRNKEFYEKHRVEILHKAKERYHRNKGKEA